WARSDAGLDEGWPASRLQIRSRGRHRQYVDAGRRRHGLADTADFQRQLPKSDLDIVGWIANRLSGTDAKPPARFAIVYVHARKYSGILAGTFDVSSAWHRCPRPGRWWQPEPTCRDAVRRTRGYAVT